MTKKAAKKQDIDPRKMLAEIQEYQNETRRIINEADLEAVASPEDKKLLVELRKHFNEMELDNVAEITIKEPTKAGSIIQHIEISYTPEDLPDLSEINIKMPLELTQLTEKLSYLKVEELSKWRYQISYSTNEPLSPEEMEAIEEELNRDETMYFLLIAMGKALSYIESRLAKNILLEAVEKRNNVLQSKIDLVSKIITDQDEEIKELKKKEEIKEELKKREEALKKREEALKKKEEALEKLHKQPRGYLKTTAKLVGKATDEKTLFSLPDVIPESGGNFIREVISRNTAILGNYLLQLWQQNGGGELVINNLSPIAEIMGNSNYEIKIYLLYLGGYVYPIIDKDQYGLTLTTEQLFKVKFRYSPKVAAKYSAGDYTEVGSGLTKFIKDEPVDSIEITPSPLFIQALEGKGLGNVLVVNDKFIKLALSLTDIAYKILNYSASNKPSQKIAEENLVKHLGLEKQIKTQGKPRVRSTILKGLQELKDKEHIKSYSYEEEKGMYVFVYSDKYVRHQEPKKNKDLNL